MKHDIPADVKGIRYIETDLSPLRQHPHHFDCGFYMICIGGHGTVSTGIEVYVLKNQAELVFLTGGLVRLVDASADFRVRMILFARDVYLKIALPIDNRYFNYTHEHPYYLHTPDERSQRTWREMVLWMDVAQMLFSGSDTQFRPLHEHNYLQSLLMWAFGTIQEKIEVTKDYTRKQLLCHRFLHLVRECCREQHQVAYYAERLCITPRYLYEVTTQSLDGKTPKMLIDEQLLAEVSASLAYPDLSVTEIARRLGFPDQSYLSRFCKKCTGLSPKELRARKGC